VIAGVGVDIVEIARIRAALENPKTGERFRQRVFTAGEIAYCSRRRLAYESYAARFAAKEAVVKVLGQAVGWLEIEISRTDGPPSIELHGRARERADALGITRMLLSLSHTAELAIAYVVAES
jgi:holo-[acyl-carrier protein] synthase